MMAIGDLFERAEGRRKLSDDKGQMLRHGGAVLQPGEPVELVERNGRHETQNKTLKKSSSGSDLRVMIYTEKMTTWGHGSLQCYH